MDYLKEEVVHLWDTYNYYLTFAGMKLFYHFKQFKYNYV